MSDREPSDREQCRRERGEQRTNAAAEHMGRGMTGEGVTRGAARLGRGNEEPPTPPPTRNGPVGHYGESENEETGVGHMTEEEFDRIVDPTKMVHPYVATAN